jgi:DNA-binding transcriptional ArsR family regulator
MFGEQGAEVILRPGGSRSGGQRSGKSSPGDYAANGQTYSFDPVYGDMCGAASASLGDTENCHLRTQAEEIQHCKQAVRHPIEHLQIGLQHKLVFRQPMSRFAGSGRFAMKTFDIAQIDDVIHARMRLGIMAYLADTESADFNALKTLLRATQGNLSVHLRKLEAAGYIAVDKGFSGRKPLTRVRMTPSGRKAFAAHIEALVKLIA